MPPRPRPISYVEAMAALHDAYRAVREVLKIRPMNRRVRVQLEFLNTDLATLLTRDDGKRR
jgi:CTP synthase (UTP-ammonia lyase)